MLVWIPATIILLIGVGVFLSYRKTTQIPVFINGLIPGLPNAVSKEESGSTVFIVYTDENAPEEEKEIFRGYANENG